MVSVIGLCFCRKKVLPFCKNNNITFSPILTCTWTGWPTGLCCIQCRVRLTTTQLRTMKLACTHTLTVLPLPQLGSGQTGGPQTAVGQRGWRPRSHPGLRAALGSFGLHAVLGEELSLDPPSPSAAVDVDHPKRSLSGAGLLGAQQCALPSDRGEKHGGTECHYAAGQKAAGCIVQ